MTAVRHTYGPGDIVECRTPRKDNSHERGRILDVDSGGVEIEVLNPRNKRQPRTRRLPYMRVGAGVGNLGNYKLVERADGTRVEYPKGKVV